MPEYTLSYLWQPSDGGVRLLKVFGYETRLQLPETINDKPITELGSYCFADRLPSWKGQAFLDGRPVEAQEPGEQIQSCALAPAICGKGLEAVSLPDHLQTIHNGAFYNCRSLHTLSAGAAICGIGSDVFTNDNRLKLLVIRSSDQVKSGLPLILERFPDDLTVHFTVDGKLVSALFFPEYYEWLDEVTPAHLFTRSVHGEGFRMRKACSGGRIDYVRYDQCYPSALIREPVSSLLTIALNRLRYPVSLTDEAGQLYRDTVTSHLDTAFKMAVKDKDVTLLEYLSGQFDPSASLLDAMRDAAIASEWGEGAAVLIRARAALRTDLDFHLDW